MTSDAPRGSILGMAVDRTTYEHACRTICDWATSGLSRYVCVATVNNVMESYDSARFRSVMNGADMVTPDGMPLVWGLQLLGDRQASRVYGPELTPLVLERAAAEGIAVGFFGGTPQALDGLLAMAGRRFPALRVAYSFSPPFRPLSEAEDRREVERMNASGARILFIGLNTPKQDYWMAEHKNRVRAVMLGVGAAFDFLSGAKRQAPRWMMRSGLEWLFRLASEPRRLWRRYLKHNPRFVLLFALQLLGWRDDKAGTTGGR